MSDEPKKTPENLSPEMRRGVSRRALITEEFSKASLEAARKLPSIAPLLKLALREGTAQRDARLVTNLWQLLMGREPKAEERAVSMEGFKSARTPEERGDALVDVLWALSQSREFEELNRPNAVLLRGLYRIALDRDPTEAERAAALELLDQATEPAARAGTLEGLFTGLIRSAESVVRKSA